jgi:hypothetical protein
MVIQDIGVYLQSLRNYRVLRGITTEDTEYHGVLLQIWFSPRTPWWFFFKMKNPGSCSWVSSLDRKFIILARAIPQTEDIKM